MVVRPNVAAQRLLLLLNRHPRWFSSATKRRLTTTQRLTTTVTTTKNLQNDRSFSTAAAADSSTDNNNNNNNKPLFDKVLIANRGEIACRILRTCHRLEIPTVALYSVADGPQALHARMATEAMCIGHGPSPTDSYLLQEEILHICHDTGATAIHPGYGFLSERATFARKVEATDGITLIGPPSQAMESMGSKSESKAIMEAAGVPTLPGYYSTSKDKDNNDDAQSADRLRHQALQMGFPLLIKAVMGGGGKGMRIVWHEKDFLEALESCQRESKASFGDDAVLLEKYLVNPRHVEVQVMGDKHGNYVHLYERDCSLQRRHQKIIEEAPAADLPPSLRQKLGWMGIQAAQAVNYTNAGTVEFLLDTQADWKKYTEDNPDMPFYFCEMNTRLQVEHPVTELITGNLDLVEWQLRIAAGQTLPILNVPEIPCQGHAFEARIYAERTTPEAFFPATGHVWHHQPPAVPNTGINAETGVRVDTGIQAGQDVTVHYDPIISKLIVHGPNREAALQQLIRALRDYQIAGVPTNISFLLQCAQHPAFLEGGINTGFLQDYAKDLHPENINAFPPPPLAQAVGALAVQLHLEQRRGNPMPLGTAPAPWSSHSGSWRLGGEKARPRKRLVLVDPSPQDMIGGSNKDGDDGAEDSSLEYICNRDGSFEVVPAASMSSSDDSANTMPPTPIHVAAADTWDETDGVLEVVINHKQRMLVTTVLREEDDNTIEVCMWPKTMGIEQKQHLHVWQLQVRHPLRPASLDGDPQHLDASSGGRVKAPMPGKICRILFQVGDTVQAGTVVMVMEAMKMEHSIRAPRDGILTEIRVQQDDVVDDGAVLIVVEGEGDQ